MLLEDLAKDLVSYTSDIVEGRTINVMNTEGIIVASTEEQRIGTFHQGAMDVIRTGKPVAIEPEDVSKYPGAKQGYNMPIRIEGEIIGVIGIFGTPAEIKPLARLLEVFAAKYYQLEALAMPRLKEAELRSRMLRSLLYPGDHTLKNVQMLTKELHLSLSFPLTVAVISPVTEERAPDWETKLSVSLKNKRILDESRDLWGAENDCMVVLSSTETFAEAILKSGLVAPEGAYRVSIGDICRDLREIPHAYEQAALMNHITTYPFSDMKDPENRMRYLMRRTAEQESAFLDQRLELLEALFSEEDLYVLFHSAAVYYHMSHSVTEAADILFVHKNTLQYRLRRLENALDIREWPDFRKEYLIRLLLERFKYKHGLRTLL